MNFVGKVICKTVGVAGLGVVMSDTVKGCKKFADRQADVYEAEHMQKIHDQTRTLDSESDFTSVIAKKTSDFRANRPFAKIKGNFKGGFVGTIYSLGLHLPVLACSALALICKGKASAIGAIGVGVSFLYEVLRSGFGMFKTNPRI